MSLTVACACDMLPQVYARSEAGPHQEVKPATLVTLDGTSSSHADGDPLTYIWSFDAGSPTATRDDDQSPTPSFMPVEGEYRFRLEVDDGTEEPGNYGFSLFRPCLEAGEETCCIT